MAAAGSGSIAEFYPSLGDVNVGSRLREAVAYNPCG